MGLAFTCLTIILIISPIIVPIIGEIRVEQLYLIVFYIQCYCSYYLAQHGNELYAKNLLEKGFEFHNTDPQIIEYVKKKWDIK